MNSECSGPSLLQGATVTYVGVVHPWHCDSMGHLNSAYYARVVDDANAALMQAFGFSVPDGVRHGIGWADVRLELDFRAELIANCIIKVTSRVEALGRTSVQSRHAIYDQTHDRLSAEASTKSVCFDLATRRARPLPEDFRVRALIKATP